MRTVVEPVSSFCRWSTVAGISELQYSALGLRVVVSAPEFSALADFGDSFVDVLFPAARAFRCVDGGDLESELERQGPGGPGGYLVYRVISGGWLDAAPEGSFIHSKLTEEKEWLVVSQDLCVSVIGSVDPLIREFDDYGAQQAVPADAAKGPPRG